MEQPLGLGYLLKTHRGQIAITWILTLAETILLALVPLLIGFTIDEVLAGKYLSLSYLLGGLAGLIIISVVRRVYDTRVYTKIWVKMMRTLCRRLNLLPTSIKNARFELSRELVDFLEHDLPQLISSLIQVLVAFAILASFQLQLAATSLATIAAMILLYAPLHRRFFRLNAALNQQKEAQVRIIEERSRPSFRRYLQQIRRLEIHLSDTEAILYGLIFVAISLFIVTNLYFGATLEGISAGKLFAIVSYSWEYAEAAIALPAALQTWTRLEEIIQRINLPVPSATNNSPEDLESPL